MVHCVAMDNKDPKIVIVGAGAAGLSAAHHLVQNGFRNVVILEATDRIGGRIHTVPFGDGIVELGANWIHGIGEDNSMFTLAESKGLIQKPYVLLDRIEGQWCTEDGQAINKDIVEKAWKIFCKMENEAYSFCQNEMKEHSFPEFMERQITKALNEFQPDHRGLARASFNCMINYIGFHIGDELKNISLELSGLYKDIGGGNVKIPKGFSEVVKSLLTEMPKGIVQFGKIVTGIRWDNVFRKVHVIYQTGPFQQEYVADHVIVTCSLGYLKAHHETLFQPPLPQVKVDAITSMGFGKVNKIFLHYNKPFWVKSKGGVKLAWKNLPGLFEKDQWYKSIFAFDEVLNNPSVLVAWIHGNSAAYMEKLPEEEISRTCTSVLRAFLRNPEIPYPSKVRVSAWCSNQYSLGSYSYFASQSRANDIKNLADPLVLSSKPVVCFAGEATMEQFFSTTHGARSSGIREASRIIKHYKNQSKL